MRPLLAGRLAQGLIAGFFEFLALFLVLAVAFDGEAREALPKPWAIAMRLAPRLVLVALSAGTVGAIAARRAHFKALETIPSSHVAGGGFQSSRIWLPIHLAAFATLSLTTYFALAGALSGPTWQLWLALWALSGLIQALSLVVLALQDTNLLTASTLRFAAACASAGTVISAAALNSSGTWAFLATPTLAAVTWLLSAMGQNVGYEAADALLWLNDFAVIIDDSCSGSDGIVLIMLFVALHLTLTRRDRRFPNALVLLPVAAIAAWLANVVRISALVLVGAYISPELASGAFHANAGWAALCGLALSLIWIADRSPWLSVQTVVKKPETTQSPGNAHLVPLLVILLATLLANVVSADSLLLHGARLSGGALSLFAYRKCYTNLVRRPTFAALAVGIAVYACWVLLAPHADIQEQSADFDHRGDMPRAVLHFLSAVLVIPLAEELAFRGYLQRRLVSPDFTTVSYKALTLPALLIPALAFGFFHAATLAAIIAGLAYALVTLRSGSLTDAIVAHGVTNALLMVTAT